MTLIFKSSESAIGKIIKKINDKLLTKSKLEKFKLVLR